jgi:hypothetical protein
MPMQDSAAQACSSDGLPLSFFVLSSTHDVAPGFRGEYFSVFLEAWWEDASFVGPAI